MEQLVCVTDRDGSRTTDMRRHRLLVEGIILCGLVAFAGCGSDDGGGDNPVEPTAFRVHVENVAVFTHVKSGAFAMKVGADAPGPLAPGDAYELKFTAGPKHRLSFATMFGQSNDWFFAPADGSIALFDDDGPISGDITDQIALFDAGTEVDEEPAVGEHTGPKQSSSPDGLGAADPNNTVRVVPDPVTLTSGDTFDRPAVADMISVTVASNAETREFTVRIENVSVDDVTLVTSDGAKKIRISPGVWSLGSAEDLLFTEGQPDRGEGLEQIAEGGDVSVLDATLAPVAGVATPISPGVYVLHSSGNPLFDEGQADRGLGLELIAERGNPEDLAASFGSQLPDGASEFAVYNTPAGAGEPGPIRFGDAYDIDFEALPGDRFSFASMYGASNDWIFASRDDGIALFDSGGQPVTGDVTADVSIWDVGTELNEEPAIGPNIGGPEGPADPNNTVRQLANSDYPVPADQHILVTITTR